MIFKVVSIALMPKAITVQLPEVITAFNHWCEARGFSIPEIKRTELHNSSRSALSAAENIARVLYLITCLSQNGFKLANELTQMVNEDTIKANTYLETSTGYSVSQDQAKYFPELISIDNPLGFFGFPDTFINRFIEAREAGQSDSFFQELGKGHVCYQAISEEINKFKPATSKLYHGLELLSYDAYLKKFLSTTEDGDTQTEYVEFLQSQFTILQARRFLELNNTPRSDDAETNTLQSKKFLSSPFGDTKSIGYLRGFIQFLEQKIGLKPAEITKILLDSELKESLYPFDGEYTQHTGFEAVKAAFEARQLGHRVESTVRGIDERDMGGAWAYIPQDGDDAPRRCQRA